MDRVCRSPANLPIISRICSLSFHSPKSLWRFLWYFEQVFRARGIWSLRGLRSGITRRIISISRLGLILHGSCTRDSSLVVLLREAGTNRRGGLASPSFPLVPSVPPFFYPFSSSHFAASLPTLFISHPLPFFPSLAISGTVLSSHATFSERGLRLSGAGSAWSRTTLLYLLIIF